jgi:hypothetical protein
MAFLTHTTIFLMETITITTDVLGGVVFLIILLLIAFFTLLYKYFDLSVEYARTREGWYHTRQKVDELTKAKTKNVGLSDYEVEITKILVEQLNNQKPPIK